MIQRRTSIYRTETGSEGGQVAVGCSPTKRNEGAVPGVPSKRTLRLLPPEPWLSGQRGPCACSRPSRPRLVGCAASRSRIEPVPRLSLRGPRTAKRLGNRGGGARAPALDPYRESRLLGPENDRRETTQRLSIYQRPPTCRYSINLLVLTLTNTNTNLVRSFLVPKNGGPEGIADYLGDR